MFSALLAAIAKLDWKDFLLFLSSFIPALTKALQAAVAGGVKLDFVTVLMMVIPVIFTSLAVLKNPGSANAPALAAKSNVVGFKPSASAPAPSDKK